MTRSLNNSGGATRWLNTHGLLVNYLHMRIDSRPKYYEHQEYLREDASQNIHERPQIVDLSVLKRQVISEITGELAKNPEVSVSELESEFRQWRSGIEKTNDEETINNFKKYMLMDIREKR